MRGALANGGHDNVTVQLISSPLKEPQSSWPKWPKFLPRIFGQSWLDLGLYLLAIVSLIVIAAVTTG